MLQIANVTALFAFYLQNTQIQGSLPQLPLKLGMTKRPSYDQ